MIRTKYIGWLAMFLALWGCRKDVEEFRPYAPSAAALGQLLEEQVSSPGSHTVFSFNALAEDKVLVTPQGTKIFLVDTDNLFANPANGAPVPCSTCNDLKIEVTEVFDKSDIIARGLNTVSDGDVLFESGGMVRITVGCNGQSLTLMPDRALKVQIPNNTTQSGLSVYHWNPSAISTQESRWTKTQQEVFQAEWPVQGNIQQGYELLLRQLGWAACGTDLTETTSSFCIELPSGFGEQNTLAFLAFKDRHIVAPLRFDMGKNRFCFPRIPLGYQVQMVALSKLGQKYWLGEAQTESGTNTVFPLGTRQQPEEALLNFIKSL